ncbi:MAG: hypothetical protein EOS76_11745 [Mesorhizobium sp.]|uniref:hypothetical protein n=1 Tax=unclassified Mesorhizobium TaxID=325217 RepID=UPI000F756A0C|nr:MULTISPECIES: hypothetical protein [unclassified Mesorhizobium]AZO35478.1 hypothetical protein EJ072_14125 [Mesorhizobium sp. M2A.F.Ca.ET.046.03.2.1]RVC78076.1 hypothetical protein EN766_10205 [Mesorhizobium sp. M2A.F.Ca.ET.046.02.1.1]RWB45858.1 MAG: hypothetical protein EOQ44_10755 [Mesorhizobium sp.]RWE19469.1 MAG: hypothetical protein EOS76_11745 [Mesorhizobium sp.]
MHRERTSTSSSRRCRSENSIIALLARQDSAEVQSIWQNESILEYLLPSDSRRHTWHAWLAVHGAAIHDVAEAYQFLTFAKSRQILTDAFGSCPAGMVSALGNFGPFARPKHAYIALHQVLSADGPLAHYVHQSAKMDDDDLASLATAVTMTGSNRVVRALLKCKTSAQAMVDLLWVISRMASRYEERHLVRCISEGRQPANILANLYGLVPFPAPPFEQVGALIPITTADQLRKAGQLLRNCLSKRGEELAAAVASVLSGQRYFYRWDGENPALLAFARCGSAGWILAEHSGPANSRVPAAVIEQVEDVLADIPSVFIGNAGSGMLRWICTR